MSRLTIVLGLSCFAAIACADRDLPLQTRARLPALSSAVQLGSISLFDVPSSEGGSGNALAFSINSLGQIVGRNPTSAGPTHAALWDNGFVADLGSLGAGSEAYGINPVGDIVGESVTADGETHAFFWTNGLMTDLMADLRAVFGSSFFYSSAHAINARGQIVGSVNAPDGAQHCFLYDHGVVTQLAELTGAYCVAR